MLYNKNWEFRPHALKRDINSLASFIDWLEQQPADRTYDYLDGRNCLCYQYYTAMGVDVLNVHPDYYKTHSGELIDFPSCFNYIAVHGVRTFGAALKRAKNIRI